MRRKRFRASIRATRPQERYSLLWSAKDNARPPCDWPSEGALLAGRRLRLRNQVRKMAAALVLYARIQGSTRVEPSHRVLPYLRAASDRRSNVKGTVRGTLHPEGAKPWIDCFFSAKTVDPQIRSRNKVRGAPGSRYFCNMGTPCCGVELGVQEIVIFRTALEILFLYLLRMAAGKGTSAVVTSTNNGYIV